jgi:hypothetical protein
MSTAPAYNSSSVDFSTEKQEVRHVSGPGSLESGEGRKFDAAQTKRLLRRMDWHLVPFLALLYLYVERAVIASFI